MQVRKHNNNEKTNADDSWIPNFTDGYRIYHPFGTLMVVGLLVMATSVTLMARAHDDDPSGGSTNHLLLVQLIAAYVVSVVQLFSV